MATNHSSQASTKGSQSAIALLLSSSSFIKRTHPHICELDLPPGFRHL